MEDLNEVFCDHFNFDDYSYYYHITTKDAADEIIDEGLEMADKYLYSTTIPLTEDMISEPSSFLKNEKGFEFREAMVIIGKPNDEDNIIEINSNSEKHLKYKISKEYIMGYFDLDDLCFKDNPEYIEAEDYTYAPNLRDF